MFFVILTVTHHALLSPLFRKTGIDTNVQNKKLRKYENMIYESTVIQSKFQNTSGKRRT